MKNLTIALLFSLTSATAFADYGRRTWTCTNSAHEIEVTVAYSLEFASHSLVSIDAIDVAREFKKSHLTEEYAGADIIARVFDTEREAISYVEGSPLVIKLWSKERSNQLLTSVVTLNADRKRLKWETKRGEQKGQSLLFDCVVHFTPAN